MQLVGRLVIDPPCDTGERVVVRRSVTGVQVLAGHVGMRHLLIEADWAMPNRVRPSSLSGCAFLTAHPDRLLPNRVNVGGLS